MRFAVVALLACVASSSCATSTGGDPHSNEGVPPVGGKDKRIQDIADPNVDGHLALVTTTQAVSGAIVVAVDKFDETQNGKGTGTIYVQDIGSSAPYSGITLFGPTFNPGNLAVSPGDVLDLRGEYTEASTIGTTVTFAPGTVLPQISLPVATFRYETQVPAPVDIDAADLSDYAKGRQWLGMLVRIRNVVLQEDGAADANGRVAIDLSAVKGGGTKCDSPFPKPASLTNDLFDMASMGLKRGTKFGSIVGVVGFFCNLKLAPRSAADLQP